MILVGVHWITLKRYYFINFENFILCIQLHFEKMHVFNYLNVFAKLIELGKGQNM